MQLLSSGSMKCHHSNGKCWNIQSHKEALKLKAQKALNSLAALLLNTVDSWWLAVGLDSQPSELKCVTQFKVVSLIG